MSYTIIIRGPAGVGKSTIAQKLARELDSFYVSFDKILSDNDLDIIKDGCIPSINFLKANKIVLPKVLENINNKKNIIFDGCFYHMSQIEDLINKIPTKIIVFSLKADLNECIARDTKRTGLAEIGNQRVIDVYKLVSNFDYGIPIETNQKSVKNTIKDIISYLPKKC